MSKPDYYQTLGVQKTVSTDELKKAYRKLAMQYHPDKNQGDKKAEAKFKEINEAYDVLKDEQKRSAYDRFGHQAFEGGMGGGGGAGAHGFDFTGSFADIFDDLFGGRRGGQPNGGAARGADLRYNLTISLEDAYKGKTETIRMTTAVSCDTCHGSGAAKGSHPVTCNVCGGAGKVRASQGFFTIERTCAACQGQGKTIKDPCKSCAGTGRMKKERQLSVSIPAGVEDGTRIRLSGEGEAGGRGGQAGDLYIFISIRDHKFFQREGTDLHCEVPVKMTTAILGGSVEVPTLGGGRVKVNVPEGTQGGHVFRLRGKGMPVMKSSYQGDMYIHLKVETPVKLNKQQKDLLKQLDQSLASSSNPESSGFFARVKDLWDDLRE